MDSPWETFEDLLAQWRVTQSSVADTEPHIYGWKVGGTLKGE